MISDGVLGVDVVPERTAKAGPFIGV